MTPFILAVLFSVAGGAFLARACPPVSSLSSAAAAVSFAAAAVFTAVLPRVVVLALAARAVSQSFPNLQAAVASLVFALCAAVVFHAALAQKRRLSAKPPKLPGAYLEKPLAELMRACAAVAVLVTFGVVFSVLFESIRFFRQISPLEFFFGLEWSPQTALRADQAASSGRFGIVPLLAGTALISAVALAIAVPFGVASAVWLSEFASRKTRAIVKPIMEMLAGIPTVVYGVFAAVILAPRLRDFFTAAGVDASPESALAAGLVMGVMVLPFVASLSEDALASVPERVRDGALAMGSTRAEAAILVQVPAAMPGIVAGILLAASRAVGETMIVVMAAGLAANLTANPLEAVTTITVQIVTLLTGDQEFDSAKTLSAFALGLTLFAVTLIFNVVALRVVRKHREAYDS